MVKIVTVPDDDIIIENYVRVMGRWTLPNYKGCPFCIDIPDKDERILIVYHGQKWYAHQECYDKYIEEVKYAVNELIAQGKWW